MKVLVSVIFAALLTGCGTLGGAVSGMGEDLQKAGDWIREK
jgi:predicted small secreted protein